MRAESCIKPYDDYGAAERMELWELKKCPKCHYTIMDGTGMVDALMCDCVAEINRKAKEYNEHIKHE